MAPDGMVGKQVVLAVRGRRRKLDKVMERVESEGKLEFMCVGMV